MALAPRAAQSAAVISLFAVLGTLFVALRLWTRFVIIHAPGYEDWVLILSWICAVVTVITIGLEVHFGLGNHGIELSPDSVEKLSINIYISISTYCATIGLTKIAILIQYHRVFPTQKFRIWCWILLAIMISYTIATVVACIFVCTPVNKFWQPQVDGHCINTFASWFSNAILNVVTDLVIIITPMPVIRSLKLPKKQKYLLMGVFAFGVVVCIISIVRLHSLIVITHSTDPSYDNAPVATFSIVEVNVSLICACLPTLRPLLAKWISGLNSTAYGSSGMNQNNSHSRHSKKRSSVLPALGPYGMQLNSLSSKRGVERLDGDDEEEAMDDKIRVVTRVDVNVHGKDGNSPSLRDGRECSTESLFRDAKHIV